MSTEEIATSSEITADVDYTTVKDEGEGTDEVLKQVNLFFDKKSFMYMT